MRNLLKLVGLAAVSLVFFACGSSAGSSVDEPAAVPVVVTPGKVLITQDIDPAADVTVTFGNQFAVTIPKGAASAPAVLTITGADLGTVKLPWSAQECYDVVLKVGGVAVQPAVPLTLRFRGFPSTLRAGLPAEDQLIATVRNDGETEWRELPFRMVTEAGVTWMEVTSNHLTSFGKWLISSSYSVLSVPGWRFYFDANENGAGFGVSGIEALVAKYRGILDTAHDAYVADGFASPRDPPTSWTKVSVYVVPMIDAGAYYNATTGNIILNTKVAADDESRDEAQHELFHLFQNAALNMLTMDSRRWFVEAAATYAADRIAPATGGSTKSMKKTFLGIRLDMVDGVHEYATASLLTWAIARGADLKDLQDQVFAADKPLEVFGKRLTVTTTGCDGADFADTYQCFVKWLLFDAQRPLQVPVTDWATTASAFDDWAEGAPVTSVKMKGLVMPWTADVWTVEVKTVQVSRLVRVLTGATVLPECRYKAYRVRNADPTTSVELAPLTNTDGVGFEKVEVVNGDFLVLVSTTQTACLLAAEVRDASFCKGTKEVGGVVYECEDASGIHTADPSYCDGDSPVYKYMKCYSNVCVQEQGGGNCAQQYPSSPYCDLTVWGPDLPKTPSCSHIKPTGG